MQSIIRIVVAATGAAFAASAALASITSVRLGDGTGEDWEPASIVDGSYVYLVRFLGQPFADLEFSSRTLVSWHGA